MVQVRMLPFSKKSNVLSYLKVYIFSSLTIINFRNSSVITSNETFSITFNGKEARLKINNASLEETGTYKIVVSTEYGKDESSAELTVKVRTPEKLVFKYLFLIMQIKSY